MKKILSLTLIFMMLITLMSCTPKKKTAYEIITDAQAKTNELDSLDMSVDMQLRLGTSGLTFSIPAIVEMKIAGVTTDSPKASIHADMSFLGVEIGMDLYYEDEYLYLSALESTGKISTKDLTDKLNTEDSSSEAESFQDEYNKILEAALAEVEVIENTDGSKTVSYVISGESMNTLINKLMESSKSDEESSESVQASEIECSDIEVTQTISKDGYITVSDIKCDISVTQDLGEAGAALGMETSTSTYKIEATATLNNPGAQVEVTPIEGYETFEDISPEEITMDM